MERVVFFCGDGVPTSVLHDAFISNHQVDNECQTDDNNTADSGAPTQFQNSHLFFQVKTV